MIDVALLATIASLLGIGAKDLLALYSKHSKKVDDKAKVELLARRFTAAQRIISEGLHTKALHRLYDTKDLADIGLSRFFGVLEDRLIPTTIVGDSDSLETEIELDHSAEQHEIIKPTNGTPSLNSEIAAQVLADINFRGLKVWDQPIYRLSELSVKDSILSAKFTVESFMEYRLGIGALWDELLQGLIDSDFDVDDLVSHYQIRLPFRNEFLPNSKVLANYSSRMCAGGIHATVAILRPDPDDDFVIPIQQRAANLSEGQNLITVIPEAFHQPMLDPQAELNFSHTFYRELYEELFGGEEMVKNSRRLRPDWYMYYSPPLKWLKSNPGSYRLVCTGFGLNLVSGNYEIALLCIIRDPQFWQQFSHMLVTNWEASESISPLISTKVSSLITNLLSRHQWTGSGVFSLCRGLSYLHKIEPTRLDLPEVSSYIGRE